MGDDMSAYRDVFLSESAEYLQAMTEGLIALEEDPHDLEPVETVFRGAHSLKGMAGAMGYAHTQELTHTMESLMDTVRQRRQTADHTLIDLMLRATDAVRALIDDESRGSVEYDVAELVASLVARTEAAGAAGVSAGADTADRALYRVRVTLEPACVLRGVRAYMVIKRLNHMGTVVETRPEARELEDEQFGDSFDAFVRTQQSPEALVHAVLAVTEIAGADVEFVEAPAEGAADAAPAATAGRQLPTVPKLSEAQTVRISIGHLDNMVNLVGELVIIRSRLEKTARLADVPDLNEALIAFGQVSAELQHEVMRTRMVPVGNIFNRFPRMVRDLGRDLGKDVALHMSGLEIELDRTVLDEIGDPIVHLLRNAIDHGIESPAERAALGKPERGTVSLAADREREQVRITVTDDGRGMDLDRIWQTAVKRGVADPAARDAYTDAEIFLLTCQAGFSTKEETTAISGRGVGMDVVKGKIEYLGGTISLHTVPGEGTRVTLLLPLTLAIIQALLIGSGDQVYAMPLAAVDEVLGLDELTVKTVDGRPVAVLRDGVVVSLQRLDRALGAGAPGAVMPDAGDHVVLFRVADEVRALAVPRLLGRQEIVIKPLSPLFRGTRGFGGATVLGDGRVALILDPRALVSED